MIDLGIHSPFEYVEQRKDVDGSLVYKLESISIKLTALATEVLLINVDSGTQNVMTLNNYTHTIGDDTVKSCLVTGVIPATGSYYLKISGTSKGATSVVYSDGIIQKSTCNLEIQSANSCSDQYYDWDSNSATSIIKVAQYSDLETSYKDEKTTVYGSNGAKDIIQRQIKRMGFEFVAPTGWINQLNGIKANDTNAIKDFNGNVILIKNIEIEFEKIGNGKYSKFIFTYEYDDYTEGSTCCEIFNIDTLASPDYVGGGTCGLFAVTIGEAAGILTPTPTDAPVGTVTYRWFKNGAFISSAGTLAITDSGNYKVEAKVDQCVVNSTYYSPDECALFLLQTTLVNNTIDAAVSNIPDGESVTYSVKKDGTEVSTTLPYVATISGTYFVVATAGNCNQTKGQYINIVVPTADFTISITQADGILTAVTDAVSPVYQWELEVFNAATGTTSRSIIGTDATQVLSGSGIYHLTITSGLESKIDQYLFQTGLNVNVTNITDISNASGSIQTITGVTGNSFALDYDSSRWILFRNGIQMTFKEGIAAGSLDVNDYDVVAGNLITSSVFPLVVADIIEIKPV